MRAVGTEQVTQRRDEIVRCAARLFAERGFSSVSVDELGTALGVSGPALYHHFPSKDALLAAIVLETMHDAVTIAEATATELDRGMPPNDVLAELVGRIVTLEIDRRDDITVYLRDGHLLDRPTVSDLHRREERLARAWYRVIHSVAPDLPGRRVVLAMNAIGGLVNSAARERTSIARNELESTLARMVHGLLDGLTTLPPQDANSRRQPLAWQPLRRPRREALLAAAAELFDERGYDGVGIADIGAATGVSGAAVYRHFPSKDAVLAAVVDRARERIAIAFTDALGAARSARDALDRLLVGYARIALENHHLVAIYQREIAHLPADNRAAIQRERREFASQWADVLQDIRPDTTRPASTVMVHGAMGAVDRVARVPGMREATTPTELQSLLTRALLS
jgi:AcrR family transcriptional regulator